MTKQELIDLGLSEENADKVLKDHVPYDRFKQVNDDKKALDGQIADLNIHAQKVPGFYPENTIKKYYHKYYQKYHQKYHQKYDKITQNITKHH